MSSWKKNLNPLISSWGDASICVFAIHKERTMLKTREGVFVKSSCKILINLRNCKLSRIWTSVSSYRAIASGMKFQIAKVCTKHSKRYDPKCRVMELNGSNGSIANVRSIIYSSAETLKVYYFNCYFNVLEHKYNRYPYPPMLY